MTSYRESPLREDVTAFLVQEAASHPNASVLTAMVLSRFGVEISPRSVYDLLRRRFGIRVSLVQTVDFSFSAADDFWMDGSTKDGDPLVEPIRRRCMNRDCIERFTPVNDGHWYHHSDCRKSKRLWSKEELLREEGSLYPEASGVEMAARAFGQKNNLQRRLQQARSLREYIAHEVRNLYDSGLLERIKPLAGKVSVPDDGPKGEREVVVVCSDWQIGKLENGIGVFEVINHRLPRLMNAVIEIVQHYRESGYTIRKVHVVFVGDILEGCFIFGGQNISGLDRTSNTHRMVKQIAVSAELQAAIVQSIASYVDEVEVHSVPGNHGRPNGKNDFADSEDNFDTMICRWAADKAQDLSNVTWNINDQWWGTFRSFDHNVIMMHGDQWKGPLSKVRDLLPQWTLAGTFGVKPDLLLLGHRHEFSVFEVNGVPVVQNGTIDGGSNWYLKAYGKHSRPIQTVIVSSAKRVVEVIYPIYVDEKVVRA